MTKLIWLIALVAAISTYWNIKLHFENTRGQRELDKERNQRQQLENDLISARDQRQSQINEENQIIQSLNNNLAKLNQEAQRLADQLKGTNDVELGGNNISTLEWDIRHQKELIADLDRQLKDVKAQENEASNQSKFIQSQDRWSKAQSESALQNQINYQQSNLVWIQNNLNQARQNHSPLEVIHKLQGQVSQQRAFVNNLKLQKQNLSQQWSVVSGQHDMSQSLVELKESERNLTGQLATEKQNLSRIQENYHSDKNVADTHKSQVGQLQKSYQSKTQEITSLQSEIEGHKRKLSAFLNSP